MHLFQWLLQCLTCDEIAALERQCKLLGESVLAVPDGIPLFVEVIPEVGKGYCQCVLVGVLPLELIHNKWAKNRKGNVMYTLE